MQVRVMYRNNWFGGDGWVFYPVTIVIADCCPECNGPRGKPVPHRFCEDGEWFTTDRWTNECGHIDYYAQVLVEAGYKPAASGEAPPSISLAH